MIFAVTVKIVEHGVGRMRYDSAGSNEHSNVADIFPYPFVQRLGLLLQISNAGCQLFCQGFDLGRRYRLVGRPALVGLCERGIAGECGNKQPVSVVGIGHGPCFGARTFAGDVHPLVLRAIAGRNRFEPPEPGAVALELHGRGQIVDHTELFEWKGSS